jgi:hypothetical protein
MLLKWLINTITVFSLRTDECRCAFGRSNNHPKFMALVSHKEKNLWFLYLTLIRSWRLYLSFGLFLRWCLIMYIGLPCEMDEVNADDRIQWKCHTQLSAPWAGFKPVTSEVTLPALFALLWHEDKKHSPLGHCDFSRSGWETVTVDF